MHKCSIDVLIPDADESLIITLNKKRTCRMV